MRLIVKRGHELVTGDVVRTWFGNHMILEMRPYTGPLEFLSGIACFPSAEMSIARNGLYEVLLPA